MNWDALVDCLESLERIRERFIVLEHEDVLGYLPAPERDRYLSALEDVVEWWKVHADRDIIVIFPSPPLASAMALQ
jgi:hypothetical protein